MHARQFTVSEHNAHYEGEYSSSAIHWRRLGATDKARNLRTLLGDRAPSITSVLEVGCGTGAVLQRVRELGVGTMHSGVDMANPSAHTDANAALLDLSAYDGVKLPFEDRSFDLVFSSHVLEHVSDERSFIAELIRVSRRLIYIEVPCELHMRTNHRALQRTLNIGHINAYTPLSFSLTLQTSGLKVLDLRPFEHSMEVHRFDSRSKFRAYGKGLLRAALLKISPSIATQLFTFHCGALCEAITIR